MNKELNELKQWKDVKCIYCGRKYPNTIINVEGIIHHKCKPICLDIKKCKKMRKRK